MNANNVLHKFIFELYKFENLRIHCIYTHLPTQQNNRTTTVRTMMNNATATGTAIIMVRVPSDKEVEVSSTIQRNSSE